MLSTPSAEDVYGDSRIIFYERGVGEDKEGDGNAPANLPRLQNMLCKNGRTYYICGHTRTAFDELPSNLKEQLLKDGHIADIQLGTLASSLYAIYSDFWPMLTPRITRCADIASCEASGRMNLHIAAHAHHTEDVEPNKSRALLDRPF